MKLLRAMILILVASMTALGKTVTELDFRHAPRAVRRHFRFARMRQRIEMLTSLGIPAVSGGADNFMSLPGILATGSLTQYRAVILDTSADRTVAAVTNANAQRPIGILQNDPASGEAAEVAYIGVAKAEYGGNVTRGDKLACNNSGQLITDVEVADGSATDLHHIAIALESGASSDVRQVLVIPPQRIGLE